MGLLHLSAQHPPHHGQGDLAIVGARALLIVLAVGIALAPLPQAAVERYYATGAYAMLQPALTTVSNAVPWAVLDLQVTAVAACLAWWLARRVQGRRRGGVRRVAGGRGRVATLGRLALAALVVVSAMYLVFLAVWGLNYRRAPIETRLDFDASQVTAKRVVALALRATGEVNALYAPAHAKPWPGLEALPASFGPRFVSTARSLGLGWSPVPGMPKRSFLGPYFEWASVSGMTNPFALEVLLSPDTLPFERHAVLAHEWAHLAGFAHESEANFVSWLICRTGDEQARYSGWLSVWPTIISAVPRSERPAIVRGLAPGPRADFRAMITRSATHSVPAVRDAAWRGYDVYLRSQRVPEGIASYAGVVRLMAGMRE